MGSSMQKCRLADRLLSDVHLESAQPGKRPSIMEIQSQPSPTAAACMAFEDLCRLIDAIDETTDLLERHCLFRRISRTAERLGRLRMGWPPPSDYRGAGAPIVMGCSSASSSMTWSRSNDSQELL
jgi:hypothetical protein